ncbi:hypothetical protein PFISCL1PPCAC_4160, partial [Pristionchus fissidentatus]
NLHKSYTNRAKMTTSRIIFLIFLTVFNSIDSLRCLHKATVQENIAVGPLNTNLEVTVGEGKINCDAGLDRCANFAKMSVVDFLKLDTAKSVANVALIEGQIYGYACMSAADCTTIKAASGKNCLPTPAGSSCCCDSDDCTGDSGSNLPILAGISLIAARILTK